MSIFNSFALRTYVTINICIFFHILFDGNKSQSGFHTFACLVQLTQSSLWNANTGVQGNKIAEQTPPVLKQPIDVEEIYYLTVPDNVADY